MIGNIKIIGQIGSGEDENGNLERGVELIDVISQVRAYEEAGIKDLNVQIDSPGGYVNTGDDIYNYLEDLKTKGFTISTEQIGQVGSIATKIFLAGTNRVVTDEGLFIHNPWNDPGPVDAPKAKYFADHLQQSKDSLLTLYVSKTNNPATAIEPLMDAETAIPGAMAVTLGFATELKSKAFQLKASIKKEDMDFKKSLEEIKASIKALAGTKALDINLADGKIATSDAPDEAGLVGSSVMIDGVPAPDGDMPLADGRVITIAGGKITAIKPAPAPPMDSTAQIAALTEQVNALAELVKGSVDVNAKAITEIKNQIKGSHVPAKKKDNVKSNQGSAVETLALAKEYDELMKSGKMLEVRKNDQERFKSLYIAKYDREPEL